MTDKPPFLAFQATKTLHTAQGPQLLDIGFQLEEGDLLSVYGPSGAGKTTVLRILSGLTTVASGRIEVDGSTWLDTDRHIDLPTRYRSIGFVFQDFALFPHLTVRQQLEFALPGKEDKKIIAELLALMELEALQDRRPSFLSGGQQQRVALARAIARRPRLLLLDEPLSALDEEMRFKLQEYLLTVHRHYRLTTVLVSHYLPEIVRLSDKTVVLEKGRIVKQGLPADIFFPHDQPAAGFSTPGEIINITAIHTKPDTPTNAPTNDTTLTDADTHTGSEYIIDVLCSGTLLKVVVTAEEASKLHTGQKVLIASNVFNPIILPLG